MGMQSNLLATQSGPIESKETINKLRPAVHDAIYALLRLDRGFQQIVQDGHVNEQFLTKAFKELGLNIPLLGRPPVPPRTSIKSADGRVRDLPRGPRRSSTESTPVKKTETPIKELPVANINETMSPPSTINLENAMPSKIPNDVAAAKDNTCLLYTSRCV